MMTFYRVCNKETLQGLWYDQVGTFTGLIHDQLNFCKNHELKMEFDPELCGYLSATDCLETLYNWFSKEDIIKLQDHNYAIHVYETEDFWFYERFQHWVISQQNSKLVETVLL